MKWQYIMIFIYALIQAITPLPDLEMMTFPIIIATRINYFWIVCFAVCGGLIGDSIGYGLSYQHGLCFRPKDEASIVYEQELMRRYGGWSMIFDSIMIPGFHLPYLAGHMKINVFIFLSMRATIRGVRLLLGGAVLFVIKHLFSSAYRMVILAIFFISWVIFTKKATAT